MPAGDDLVWSCRRATREPSSATIATLAATAYDIKLQWRKLIQIVAAEDFCHLFQRLRRPNVETDEKIIDHDGRVWLTGSRG